MKVIIYIGHHKVGSTSLQLFLACNWLKLIQNGILYPMVESEGSAFMLEAALCGMDHKDPLPINVREPHNTLAFRMLARGPNKNVPDYLGRIPGMPEMKRSILNQVDRLKPHTVLLCSEVMSNFGAYPQNLVGELRALFPKAEFEIYCTLRRPDEYIVSWHSQRIRFGHKIETLRKCGIKPYRQSIHFDYELLLKPWLANFSDAVFHIRNYDDVLSVGGSCEDFQKQVSLNFPRGMAKVARMNKSLGTSLIEIARQGNHILSEEHARDLFQFLLSLQLPAEIKDTKDIEMLGHDAREELLNAFAPIHKFLNATTGITPFFPNIERARLTRPLPEERALRIALAHILKTPPKRQPSPPIWSFLKSLAERYY